MVFSSRDINKPSSSSQTSAKHAFTQLGDSIFITAEYSIVAYVLADCTGIKISLNFLKGPDTVQLDNSKLSNFRYLYLDKYYTFSFATLFHLINLLELYSLDKVAHTDNSMMDLEI